MATLVAASGKWEPYWVLDVGTTFGVAKIIPYGRIRWELPGLTDIPLGMTSRAGRSHSNKDRVVTDTPNCPSAETERIAHYHGRIQHYSCTIQPYTDT